MEWYEKLRDLVQSELDRILGNDHGLRVEVHQIRHNPPLFAFRVVSKVTYGHSHFEIEIDKEQYVVYVVDRNSNRMWLVSAHQLENIVFDIQDIIIKDELIALINALAEARVDVEIFTRRVTRWSKEIKGQVE